MVLANDVEGKSIGRILARLSFPIYRDHDRNVPFVPFEDVFLKTKANILFSKGKAKRIPETINLSPDIFDLLSQPWSCSTVSLLVIVQATLVGFAGICRVPPHSNASYLFTTTPLLSITLPGT